MVGVCSGVEGRQGAVCVCVERVVVRRDRYENHMVRRNYKRGGRCVWG